MDRLQHMHDRLRYPSAEDGKAVLRKLIPPSALLGLAGMLKPFAPAEAEAITHLGKESAFTVDDLSKKARLAAIPGFAIAGILYGVLSYQEVRNRVQFGDHLTVSKVAPGKNYFGRTLYPELEDERFVGELHFKGKWKLRYSPEENAVTVMRAAFRDLHTLASAVEQNDSSLRDFNYFVALSSMVTPLFERFDFKVTHYKNQLGLPPLGQPNQRDIRLEMRPVMALLIDKQVLVRNKEKLARAAHM